MKPEKTYDDIDPEHYQKNGSGIQCIELTEHMNFNLGNCVKYCVRAGLKPGSDAITDLKKGAWYIAREIARLTNMNAK